MKYLVVILSIILSAVFVSSQAEITINSPLSTTTRPVIFSVTLNEDGNACNYTLTNGVTNYTMSKEDGTFEAINYTIADGIYNVIFFCNDIFGNPITNSMNFIVSQHFTINVDASISAVAGEGAKYNDEPATTDNSNNNNNYVASGSVNGVAIRLLHPPNKGVIITSNVVLFQFSVDSRNVETCDMEVHKDEILIQSKGFIEPFGTHDTIYTLDNGNYSWSLKCTGKNITNAYKRTFSVDVSEDLSFSNLSYEASLIREINNAVDNVLNNPEDSYKIINGDMENYKKRISEIETELSALNLFDFSQSARRTELIEEL
ncbi:hypothetical protein HYV49_05635, partial [Candidatus Pacearchaeota archaeon]|nr:hypothetical protein [Candidatus Pacearchaeota archaeon]